MVNLYCRYACCILYLISSLSFASAEVSLFPKTNTVPISGGNSARLIGITSINKNSSSANVVIDARDKFGNKVRVFKTAKFNIKKLKFYVTKCVKNPIACAASAALTSALLAYGYKLTSTGNIVLTGAAGSYPECVEKPYPWNGEGGVVSANGSIPCVSGPNWAKKYVLYTFKPAPQNPNLPLVNNLPVGVIRSEGFVYSPSIGEYAQRKTYYMNWYDSLPVKNALEQEISAQKAGEIALSNPRLLQIKPGVYPDVFEPVEITKTAQGGDFSNTPSDTDSESASKMIEMDSIDEKNIDVSRFFDFGGGWLPRTCPTSKELLKIGTKTFSFDYTTLCSLATDYVSPLIRFSAILAFIAIVFGVVRNG